MIRSKKYKRQKEYEKMINSTTIRDSLKKARKQDALCVAAVSLFAAYTFFLYGPLFLYLKNAEDFWFGLSDTLRAIIPVFVVSLLLFSLIGLALPKKPRMLYVCLLFGISLCLYIQGTYINADYGVLNGGKIQWETYKNYAIWDTLIWLALLLLPFVLLKLRKDAEKIITVAALFFFVIQLPAMAVDICNYTPPAGRELTVSEDGMFELAEQNNIIVLSFDSMDETYYSDYISRHPEYREVLEGFTHYDNVLAAGSNTSLGLPAILTGVPFKQEEIYSEYIEKAWAASTPLRALSGDGYDVRCYINPLYIGEASADYVKNAVNRAERVASYPMLAKKLYQLDAFRFFPHILKKNVWMTTEEFDEAKETLNSFHAGDDAYFYNAFLENGGYSVSGKYGKTLRYYHLRGMHAPYTLSSDALRLGTSTYEEQLDGCFTILKSFLEDLKEKGLYDSCVIFATADHGAEELYQHQMLLFKDAYAKGELSDSHKQVSAFDIGSCFYGKAGKSASSGAYGVDFLKLAEDARRERYFFQKTGRTGDLAHIKEYVTTEAADNVAALILSEEHLDQNADSLYSVGETLSFGLDATGNRYTVEGFDSNTSSKTSLYGHYSCLKIPFDTVPESGTMEVRIGLDQKQSIDSGLRILANGVDVFDTELTKNGQKELLFTFDTQNVFAEGDSLLTLEFYFDAVRPLQIDLPLKERTQTIAITELTISME